MPSGGNRPGAGRKTIGAEPRRSISLRLDTEVINAIEHLAKDSGLSKSQIVDMAVEEFIKRAQ